MNQKVDFLNSMEIVAMPIGEIRPDPANPRVHKKRQIRQIAESIRAFGFNVPVLVDRDGKLVAGHGRVEACRLIGVAEVPAIRLEHLTPEQAKAFLIADNRLTEISTWDEKLLAESLKDLATVDLTFNIEATGYTVGEIDLKIEGLEFAVADADADQVPARQAVAVTRLGDVWNLGEHRIVCANALEPASYEVLMSGRRAAMVITDPPYNVPIDGFAGGKGAVKHREFAMGVGEMTSAQFEAFLGTVMDQLIANAEDGALHYIFMDWRHGLELQKAAAGRYNGLKNVCVWAKDRAGMGSFYRSQHEFVFVYKSGTAPSRNNVELGRNGRHRTNVWRYPSIVNERRGDEGDLLALHPTVKPVRMVADAILDATAPREIVLDAFLGSGSTLIAAHRVGRIAYCIELDPLYVDVAIRRWEADCGGVAILAATGETFAARQEVAADMGEEVVNEAR